MMTDNPIDATLIDEGRDGQGSPAMRRLSEAEKAACFVRARNAYQTLWAGFIIEDDNALQEVKDANLPHIRPVSEQTIRGLVAQSGRKLSDLRPEMPRSEAQMDDELAQLGNSRIPLEAASLQYIAGWQHIGQIRQHLKTQGIPLDKSSLLTPYDHEGGSYLMRAAELRQLHLALRYLNRYGERLSISDLVAADGAPTRLLQACIASGEAPKLFCEENWLGQPSDGLRQLRHALPEEQQGQLQNYHGLLNKLQLHEQGVRDKGR